MTTVDVPGAARTETQAVQSLVSKKTTAATPVAAVPVETILVPATPVATTPAVAVSGGLACETAVFQKVTAAALRGHSPHCTCQCC